MDCDQFLKEQFGDLEINLVRHDTGASDLACAAKIEVKLGKRPKDMGETAKDLSNYLYRMGLKFESCPEYLGRGKSLTLNFYITNEQFKAIAPNVAKAYGCSEALASSKLTSLIIQNTARGVRASV